MTGRRFRTLTQLSTISLVILTLLLCRSYVASQLYTTADLDKAHDKPVEENLPHIEPKTLPDGNSTTTYIQAILKPDNNQLPKLVCPRPDLSRYEYLKAPKVTESRIQYFFALNLRECLQLLPRLLGSIVQTIRFLGPEHCAISIVEGNSADGTSEVLAALQPELDRLLGAQQVHFVLENGIRPLEGEGMRFKKLAELRNLALQPMLDNPEQHKDATVVFINDVSICLDDILELIHQRRYLEADMTCAMDWVPGADGPIFYDSYVSRSIIGDLFFNIPPETASYSEATNLFWNEPRARERLAAHQPFQVFSCWNGAVAFTAMPVVEKKVAFRSTYEEKRECFQAEPELFCKDMWWQGHGRIAVVPSVNLGYSNDGSKMAKEKKGYTSDLVAKNAEQEKIDWAGPPPMVKCMPTFTDQTWRPWNESLV
ncbi:capsular associated protein [Coniochaeta pulveracea]|uniref:Capsular associated protein n=1 Tax=Coniochaeta pulveracea TaxID=177199 RepID=A0A420Y8D1_9PEZI|nr:capsular associated protein [Coniochaeta pulveracea]